jgi:molybdopterin/thiamine biosynthesis adenylyltransferase
MVPWFLRYPKRLQLERTLVSELASKSDWLIGTEWRVAGDLCLDAVIRAHGHDYDVRVSFPSLYPDAPSVVRPLNMEQRLSSHQYGGADGPLCLEWGPDNWHRDVTADLMIESTYRLLQIENPAGEERPAIPIPAPSRHMLTVGQELRFEWARWYASNTLEEYLILHPTPSVGSFKFSWQTGKNWVVLVHEATILDGDIWKDAQIPTNLPGAESKDLLNGVWIKADIDAMTISQCRTLKDLQTLFNDSLGADILATDGTSPFSGFDQSLTGVMIKDRAGELHMFCVLRGDSLTACKKVVSDITPTQFRSPDWEALNGKTIGIVGLGSAGSKIAISLVRMGVRNFYLLDHDVLLPENLQRHALDWQGVAQHKVDAMAESLGRIAPGVCVESSRLHLIGQESNAAVSGALNRLAECDLLVDATANPKVFNLMAAVARTASKPMVWMEVYGGGIGGMVAMSRPEVDPTPQDMRGVYLSYCADNPYLTSSQGPADYAVETDEGDVLVASDADISIIAHHAARFVPECFASPERAKYPYSMYLIGLAREWVFEAPFATVPISMESCSAAGWGDNTGQEFSPEDVEFLLGLFKKSEDETSDPT